MNAYNSRYSRKSSRQPDRRSMIVLFILLFFACFAVLKGILADVQSHWSLVGTVVIFVAAWLVYRIIKDAGGVAHRDTTSSEQWQKAEQQKPSYSSRDIPQDKEENKRNGEAFENYIIRNLPRIEAKLEDRRSDKITPEGIYARSNCYPDLVLMVDKELVAVECKWRGRYYQNGIEWAKEYQVKNYQQFSRDKNMPVWVAIGVGGKSEWPDEVFLVPLYAMESHFISRNFLERYKVSTNNPLAKLRPSSSKNHE